MKNLLPSSRSVRSCLALGALACLAAGCEVDSASHRIEVRPDSVTLEYKESVTLSAYNGYVYDWSLSDPSLGTLDRRRGQMVTYTSLYQGTGSAQQVVTVTSTFSDSSNTSDGGTNTPTPTVHQAEAYITHINSINTP